MSSVSIETMESMKEVPKQPYVNPNLISLKCLLFFFFGGMGCLFPFLPLHMQAVGLTIDEIRLVSIISSAASILGPLIVALLADKLGFRKQEKPSNGGYLRVMIAVICVLSAISYGLLLLVPIVKKIDFSPTDTLTFSCNTHGASVMQKREGIHSTCYNWTSNSQVCSMYLKNCHYECGAVSLQEPAIRGVKPIDDIGVIGLNSESYNAPTITDTPDLKKEDIEWRTHGLEQHKQVRSILGNNEPPHLCFNEGKHRVCHVYTQDTGYLPVNASLKESNNTQDQTDWCIYPVLDEFSCRIPWQTETSFGTGNSSCSVTCDLQLQGVSVENQCSQIAGDPRMTFWIYVAIRSVADNFPTAALTLIDAAVVIATRETSSGRGDIGRQLAFGSLGFAVFGPLSGILNFIKSPAYVIPISLHIGLMLLAAIVSLAATGMPLTPPEWWWFTRSGMLAVPMSSVRRYGSETVAVVIVLVVLGTLWSTIDTYLPYYLAELAGTDVAIGVVLTIGALPAILLLWKSEVFVDYCGHSNLLIIAFTTYIVRFTGLSLMFEPWWALISEAFELFTLGIMWITAILYMRHLIPRYLTVTAQALPVIAHFCIGRGLGAAIGGGFKYWESEIYLPSVRRYYQAMAVVAAIVALIYFLLYHFILKPRCHAQTMQTKETPALVQGLKENGSYTPLRVYHNSMGRKGEFRY